MAPTLQAGLRYSKTITVDRSLVVPELPTAIGKLNFMPPVFATAYMVALAEAACVEAMAPYMAENQMSVGTHVDMSHSAATPIGMKVRAEVELVLFDERRLRFKVACFDEAEAIGAGFHERMIIDGPRFNARVATKAQKAAG